MKTFVLFLIMMVMLACGQPPTPDTVLRDEPEEQYRNELQQIIDSSGVSGSILVFDPQSNIYYSNDFQRARKGFLPASTFKIPNSIIALETGIISSDSTLIPWDGQKRRLPAWEKDLTFREAFHVSCVPCYQELARKYGAEKMRTWLDMLQFGHMIFDTTSLDKFWLEGDSHISQFEQIDFLYRFYHSRLPVTERTVSAMKRLMVIEESEKYRLSGKTGWAIRNDNNYGWFTGYLEKDGKVFFIATNIEPHTDFNMDLFPKIRNEISKAAFEKLKLI